MTLVEKAARAARDAMNDHGVIDDAGCRGEAITALCNHVARAVLEAARDHMLVFRQDGQVVHELRGAPDDIWKTFLDAALSEGA